MKLNAKHQRIFDEGRELRLRAEARQRQQGVLPHFPKGKLSGNTTWANLFIDGWNSVSTVDVDTYIYRKQYQGSDAAQQALNQIKNILGK
jgi:hypothetical protein